MSSDTSSSSSDRRENNCQSLKSNQHEELDADVINANLEFALLKFNITRILSCENEDQLLTHISCRYYSRNLFRNVFAKASPLEFRLLHVNTRSMNKNFDSLSRLVDGLDLSNCFLGISETWWTDVSPLCLYSIEDHHLITSSRGNGGGVALYVPTKFTLTKMERVCKVNIDIESILTVSSFLAEIESIICSTELYNKRIMFMGDINVNLLKHEHDSNVNKFLDAMVSSNFVPLITRPTRITADSSTLIDLIFSNMQPFPESGIVMTDVSDHFPVFARVPIDLKIEHPNNQYHPKYNYNKVNYKKFKQ